MTFPQHPHAVYSVHTTKLDQVGAIEVIFASETDARSYAQDRSNDDRVLAASVTRFVIGELGNRHPVAWYIDGVEQPRHFDRQLYPSDGTDHSPAGQSQRDRPRRGGTSPCANS